MQTKDLTGSNLDTITGGDSKPWEFQLINDKPLTKEENDKTSKDQKTELLE